MKTRAVRGALALSAALWGTTVLAGPPSAESIHDAINNEQVAPAAVPLIPNPPVGVVLHDNGPLITHPGQGFGGADASALTPPESIFGFGAQQTANNRVADDFTVPAGQTWQIDTIQFPAYQTGAAPAPPTINAVTLRIWDGPPAAAGSNIVFGDTTTNRLASSTFSNIYRVTNTTLTNNQRPIFVNVVNVGQAFPAGTYWLDYALSGTLASGPWVPPVTRLGVPSSGNAMQSVAGGPFNPLIDAGNGLPQTLPFILEATAQVDPAALAVDQAGNRVLEPNEAAVAVAPSWRNPNATPVASVTGALSNFTGPAGPTYTINDGAGAYGTIAGNATQQCTDCYAVTVTSPTRPSLHWDSVVTETTNIGGSTKDWTLHVGASFSEVPTTNPFYRFIEMLLHRGVTGGCTATGYCPGSSTTREQMAVFVLLSKEAPGYVPPACVAPNLFIDVPETSPFCRWIEELANRGVVSGCGGANYCPSNPVTREQMSIFVLRTLDPTFTPPPCVAPNIYGDVPETSPFCRYIEELTNRGIVAGCGGGNYCPLNPVTREQMGVFLAVTFGLTLYGL